MKPFCFCLLIVGTLIGRGTAYGQPKNQPVSFPTYNQIRPAAAESSDYVPARVDQNVDKQNVVFKLFGYPDGTVAYIINGKPTSNAEYAEKVVNQRGNQLQRVYIGEPAADGKRIIELFIAPNKKD